MRTREFVNRVVQEAIPKTEVTLSAEDLAEVRKEVLRLTLRFLVERDEGYGVRLGDGERGEARQYAKEHGYYWSFCMLCDRWYGGHELGIDSIMLSGYRGKAVCPECAKEAAEINKLFPNGIMEST